MYLLDTDWIIQALAGREPALRTLRDVAGSHVFVSLITIGELYERAFVSANPQAHLRDLRQFMAPHRHLGLSDPIMERFAETRATLRRRGQIIPDFDILIAATALHHDLTVLTFNLRHFERVPDFDILIAATALHHKLTLLTFNRRHSQRIPELKLFPT